jgi:hypothetical protein
MPPCSVDVLSAPTLDHARELLRLHGPDGPEPADIVLAVLDLDVRGSSATELLPRLRGIPTVFVTASPESVPEPYRAIHKGVGWIREIERLLVS